MPDPGSEQRFTISELAAQAALELSRSGVDQRSRRVKSAPNLRTIRFYSTHGLLDRPAAFRGRTALYGERHLLQLMAIKRLQARGLTLVETQERLIGLDDGELRRIARPEERRERGEGRPFWVEAPADVDLCAPSTSPEVPERASAPASGAIRGAEISGGELLLVLRGAGRELFDDDIEAIKAAAEPLIKVLRARRLIGQDRASQAGERE